MQKVEWYFYFKSILQRLFLDRKMVIYEYGGWEYSEDKI